MNDKQKKIEALELVIEMLQTKLAKLKSPLDSPSSDPCPEGQIRNAEGECVDDIG